MFFDVQNQVSVAQAITAGTTVSTHAYQKGTAAEDISIGRRMSFVVVPTVAASLTSLAIAAVQADNAALTSNLEVLNSVSVLEADLFKGAVIEIPIPQGVVDKQFLGLRYITTGGAETVTLDAYLVPADEIAKYKSFPKVVDAEV